jgi:SulP family sulfate permease
VSEPPSPDAVEEPPADGPSMLTTMFRRSPPDQGYFYASKSEQPHGHGSPDDVRVENNQETLTRVSTAEPRPLLAHRNTSEDSNEVSPLLATRSSESRGGYGTGQEDGHGVDLEALKPSGRNTWLGRARYSVRSTGVRMASTLRAVSNPKRWNRHSIWHNTIAAPLACLPAVVVGLLLNILDALSYGRHRDGLLRLC